MAQRGTAKTSNKNTRSTAGSSKRASGSSAAKKTAAKSGTASVKKENKRTAQKKKSFVKAEVSSILLIAAGLFFVFTDLGLMGAVGSFIMSVQRGFFGGGCYLFGITVAAFAVIGYVERGKYLRSLKLTGTVTAFLALTAIIHLLFAERNADGTAVDYKITELYRLSADGMKGGGAVGGLIADTLHQTIGYAGAYLVLIVLLVICVVIITEKSFVNAAAAGARKTAGAVKIGAGKTAEAARAGREHYAAHHQRIEEQREDRRQQLEAQRRAAEENRLEDEGRRREAEELLEYGREIIGNGQTGINDLGYVREPLFGGKPKSRQNIVNTNFDTEVISGLPENMEAKQRPVTIKEINYEDDTVPFEEERTDKYKSYAGIINSGAFSAETAGMAGFAAGNASEMSSAVNGSVIEEPESFDAFKPGYTDIKISGFDDDMSENEPETVSPAPEYGEAAEVEEVYSDSEEDTEKNTGEDTEPEASENVAAPVIHYGADGFAIYDEPGQEDTSEDTAVQEDDEEGLQSEHRAKFVPENEPSYITATGKEMESPDAYEAELIMNKKRGMSDAVNPEVKATREKPVSEQRVLQPAVKPKPRPYVFPKADLLERGSKGASDSRESIMNNARKLEQLLRDFGVGATVTNVIKGPRVCRYEIIPDTGVKVSKITGLSDDIKLALAAAELRIEAPIPGKSAVGIEVPNASGQTVRFRDILESEEFKAAKSKLSWGVGLDINGKPIIADIAKMPHLLVAGTTGSGKSVGINSLIMSILYRATPDEVRMILVDPKVVELSVYNGIPHLLTDVVTKPERAVSALNWAVSEMNNRYKLFQTSGTRNIGGYNEKIEKTLAALPPDTADEDKPKKLPYILIVIDELSELMMHSKKDVESAIVSLTQLARAAGLHLVVATQRPSVDVITGLIKSNIPSRIAYRLPSQTDSRTILDQGGAETLLGNGDMLYKPGDKNSPARVQGAFLSDEEVEAVVEYVRKHNGETADNTEFDEAINAQMELDLSLLSGDSSSAQSQSDRDEYFAEAGRLIINSKKASIGALQRKFKVGFNRAARIMDQLHEAGVVGDSEGTKERQILMDIPAFEDMLQNGG